MKHKLILLNLVLAGAAGMAGWRLREEWLRDHANAEKVLDSRPKQAVAPVIVSPIGAQPFVSPTYADVAQKNLFSKDRNPSVILDPVVVKPEEPMPALPLLSGVMGLPGGMVALLAEKPQARAQGIRVGQMIGPFKLVALDTQKVSFEWKGKTVEKGVDELIATAARDQAPPAVANQNAPQNPANAGQQQRIGPPVPAKPGIDIGTQMKSCNPADSSPPGTVVDGYKKISENTPFGPACRWIPAN